MTTQANQSQSEAPTDDDSSGGGLRKQLEKTIAENKTLKTRERTRAFTDAGFDTSTGLGKAISQVYDGESSKEAILEFASTEYGHTPTPSDAPQPHPQAAQIALGQHQLDQVGNVAGSITQTTRAQRLAEARASGNFEQQGAIMAAQMQEMMDRQAAPPQ